VFLGDEFAVGHVVISRGDCWGDFAGVIVLHKLQLRPGGSKMVQEQKLGLVGPVVLDLIAAVQLADEVVA